MATLHTSRAPASPSFDENDDLYNYDANIDEIFREIDTSAKIDINDNKPSSKDAADSGAALGIDEEIKVTRKRKPIAKLDDAKLLSQAGIPKLRRTAKEKLKFKGKGHEYTDAARLLNFYQLWLDDLYPRAKFSDGLAMIEKLGHSKRMQVMRREWIDEGKPRHPLDDDSHTIPVEDKRDEAQQEKRNMGGDQKDATLGDRDELAPKDPSKETDQTPGELNDATEHRSIFGGGTGKTKGNSLFLSDNEEEDDIDALLAEQSSMTGVNKDVTEHKSIFGGGGGGKIKGNSLVLSDNEDGDDLDALLAEQSSMPCLDNTVQEGKENVGQETQKPEDNFDDEMEAMAGMDDPF